MAITFNTTPDQLAELVTKSLREQLESAIRQQLELQTKDIIHQAARDILSNIEANMQGMREPMYMRDVYQLNLVFNGDATLKETL